MRLLQDIRAAIHAMRTDLSVFAPVVVILTVGIGVTSSVFTVAHAVLIRPLPYRESARIVRIFEQPAEPSTLSNSRLLSDVTYRAWREWGWRTVEDVALYVGQDRTVVLPSGPEHVRCAVTTVPLFDLLGIKPALGRFYREGETDAVVLSHRLWRDHFGADARTVGMVVAVDGRPYRIIGVAPPGFEFPDRDTRLWLPLETLGSGATGSSDIHVYFALGRLRPGFSPEDAAAEGTAVLRAQHYSPLTSAVLFGVSHAPTVGVHTLLDDMTTSVKPMLLVLCASMVLLFGVSCLDAALLLLSRGIRKTPERAVRAALGATTWRMFQTLLVESLVPSLVAAALAVGLSSAIVRALALWAPSTIPRLQAVTVDWILVLSTACLSLVAAVASGIGPIIVQGQTAPGEWLQQAGHGAIGRGVKSRLRAAFVVAGTAGAVVLIVGSVLFTRSFIRLANAEKGYVAADVTAVKIYLADSGPLAPQRCRRVFDTMLERLRSVPGVEAAGGGTDTPLDGSSMVVGFPVAPLAGDGRSQTPTAVALLYVVSDGYAEALGLKLRAGRFFSRHRVGPNVQELIVNEEFARQYLPPTPVGVRLRWGDPPMPAVAEVVGVIGNVLVEGNDHRPQAQVFQALESWHDLWSPIQLVVRTRPGTPPMGPMVRQVAREIAPEASVDVSPLADRVGASFEQPRMRAAALGVSAVVTLLLAAIGLYAVLAFNVSLREREWGIRSALGASPTRLLRTVVGEGLACVGLGLVIGLMAAACLTGAVRGLLFGMDPTDPVSFALAPVLLLPVALAACLLPALRASRANAVELLRRV